MENNEHRADELQQYNNEDTLLTQNTQQEAQSAPAKPERLGAWLSCFIWGYCLLSIIIFLSGYLTTTSSNGWFECKTTIFTTLFVCALIAANIRAIIAVRKRRDNAVPLSIGIICINLLTLAASVMADKDLMGFSIAVALINLPFLLAFIFTRKAKRLFPTRRFFLVDKILIIVAVLSFIGETALLNIYKDDQASLFTSDRAYLNSFVNQANEAAEDRDAELPNGIELDCEFRLGERALIIDADYSIDSEIPQTVTNIEKRFFAKEFMSAMLESDNGRYVCKILIRNDYSIILNNNINDGALKFSMEITPSELESYLDR